MAWEGLEPSYVVEAFGSVIWNGKNRIIVIPKRIIETLPDLKTRQNIIYKVEVFLSKKKYQESVEEILENEKIVPIHLYLRCEKDE